MRTLGLEADPQLQTLEVEQMVTLWELLKLITVVEVTEADAAPAYAELLHLEVPFVGNYADLFEFRL